MNKLKTILFLILFAATAMAQAPSKYTPNYHLPIWNFKDLIDWSSRVDTTLRTDTVGRNYLNLLSTRVDALMPSKKSIQDTALQIRATVITKEPLITASGIAKQYYNGFKNFAALNTDSTVEGATNKYFPTALRTDTLIKAYSYSGLAATDSDIVFAVKVYGLTLFEVDAIRTGGTSSSINVTRTRSGSTVDCFASNYATTTSLASAGTVQNGDCSINDIFTVAVRAITGSQKVFIQLLFTRVR